jgi:multidrug resistance efflux pump
MTGLPAPLLQHLKALPRPLLIAVGTLLLVVLLFALRPKPALKPAGDILPFVAAIPAQPQTLRPMVTLYGRVETPWESHLSSSVNTYVKSVLVEEGNKVQAGQILVQLDDSDLQLSVTQREAEVRDIEAQIDSEKQRYRNDLKALEMEKKLLELSDKAAKRYEKLASGNGGSDLNRDEALQAAQRQALNLLSREYSVQDHPNRLQRLQAQLDKLRAMRDQTALDLERSRIVAPFDGRITSVNVSPGDRLSPGDPIASLYDISHMEVRAQIPSRYLKRVKKALDDNVVMDATLVVDGVRIPLILDRLAGAVAMGQGGVDALFFLQNADTNLTLGRSAELHLHMPPVDGVIAVPPTAIYGQNRLYSVKDGVLHTLFIERMGETLMPDGAQWQMIRVDIQPGTPILTTQLSNAIGGMKVKLYTGTEKTATHELATTAAGTTH